MAGVEINGTLVDLQSQGKVGNFVVRDVFPGDKAEIECVYVPLVGSILYPRIDIYLPFPSSSPLPPLFPSPSLLICTRVRGIDRA